MSRYLQVGALLSAAVFPVVSRQASAEVLFSDNFEIVANGGNDVANGSDDATGTAPQALPLHADIGSYSTLDTNGRVAAYGSAMAKPVPAGVNANAPAAIASGGSHVLRQQGPPTSPGATGNSGGRVVGFLSKPASVDQSVFKLEFDVYASSSVSFGFGSQNPGEGGQTAGLSNPGKDRPRQAFQINLVSGAVNYATAVNVFSSTGLSFTTNTFQHYVIEYSIGSSLVKLTQTKDVAGTPTTTSVDITNPFLTSTDSDFDSTTGVTPLAIPKLTQVDALFFATGTAGSVGFVDNIVASGQSFLGDANHDGTVNALDFNALATDFGTTPTTVIAPGLVGAGWSMGDFNADRKIDTADFTVLAANFNSTYTPPPSPALGSVVPEPSAAGVLCLAAGWLAGRRARRQAALVPAGRR